MGRNAASDTTGQAPGKARHPASAARPARPPRGTVNPDGIPDELKALTRWVCWSWAWKWGKWDKPPLHGGTGRRADAWNAAENLVTFEVALATCRREGLDGVGLAFVGGDGLVGIDLDSCLGAGPGVIAGEALAIIEALDSYTDLSPSGSGVKLIVRASIDLGFSVKGGERKPKVKRQFPAPWGAMRDGKAAKVELFQSDAYFTLTGEGWPCARRTVEARQAQAQALFDRLERGRPRVRAGAEGTPRAGVKPSDTRAGDGDTAERRAGREAHPRDLSDDELWRRMFESKKGDDIKSLFGGGISAYADDESRADCALCNHLWYWTDGDKGRVWRMFLQSELGKRDKAQREDYAGHTLSRVSDGRRWSDDHPPKQSGDGPGDQGPRTPPPPNPEIDAGGGFSLRVGRAKETAGGTVKAPVEIRSAGRRLDEAQLSSTPDGRRKFCLAVAKHLPAGTDCDRLAGLVLAAARELLQARPAQGGAGTLHAFVSAWVRSRLGVAFRTPKGVWSETNAEELARGDIIHLHGQELLLAARGCADAPEARGELIRAVAQELSVVWADWFERLPDERGANLGPDSRRAERIWRAVVGVFSAPVVFEVERGRDGGAGEHAARTTLANRARGLSARAGRPPVDAWLPIQPSFDAWACFPSKGGGMPVPGLPCLGMQARLAAQVRREIPGIGDDDALLRELGLRYGILDPDPPCPPGMEDGRRFAVLAPKLAAEILSLPVRPGAGASGREVEA